MPKIIKLESSPSKLKRYRVTLQDGSHFDFGLRGGHTFIDGENEKVRNNYRLRHLANETENRLIKNYIPSPATFSYWILWGDSQSLEKNIQILNKKI